MGTRDLTTEQLAGGASRAAGITSNGRQHMKFYSKGDRVIVRISAHTWVEGRVREVGSVYGQTLAIEAETVGVDIIVRSDVVDDVVRPALRDVEPEAPAGALYRVTLRRFESGERSTPIVRAAGAEEAIDAARVGDWAGSTVVGVSIIEEGSI